MMLMFDVLGAADMMSVALEVASTVNSVVDHCCADVRNGDAISVTQRRMRLQLIHVVD
jgi:hypothetical protein